MKKVWGLLLILLIAGISFATEGGASSEESAHATELMWKTINLLIMLAAIFFIAKKYIVKFFKDRRESVASMVEEAKKAKEDSIKALEEANKKLEDAKFRLEESVKITEQTAKLEREKALQEAEEIAKRIKEQAKEAINIEIRKGEAELKKYAVEKALEISEKLIKEKMDESVNKKLLNKTIKSLEA
jgi:F-type H+-transporting ATPase subunit b